MSLTRVGRFPHIFVVILHLYLTILGFTLRIPANYWPMLVINICPKDAFATSRGPSEERGN